MSVQPQSSGRIQADQKQSLLTPDSFNQPSQSLDIAVEEVTSRQNPKRRRTSSISQRPTVWQLVTDKKHRRSVYVLFVCAITYMFNQVDRYLIAITVEDMQHTQGWGDGKGRGTKYDLLVGAIFVVVYIPSGIPMGYLADRWPAYRHWILGIALAAWSLTIIWTGFSQHYYEVAVARLLLAFFEAACTPLAGSIITDWFPKETRATALGIYNWGIYLGFSLAQGVGNVLTHTSGWRSAWWVFGFAGLVWCFFVVTMPTKPEEEWASTKRRRSSLNYHKLRQSSGSKKGSAAEIAERQRPPKSGCQSLKDVLKFFCSSPSIWMLFIASLVRNSAGYVWAYQTYVYFHNVRNQSHLQQSYYMSWIPLLCGALGAMFGGFISDRFVKRASSWRRLTILILSNLCAAPFAFLALWVPAPYCYLCLIPSNIIGEMWVGICLALVVELVPSRMKTTALSVYFFAIGLGGLFPNLVTPLNTLLNSYKLTVMILFPGLYVIASILFLLTMLTIRRDKRRAKQRSSVKLNTF